MEDIRERTVLGRKAIGELRSVIKVCLSMEVKRGEKKRSIILSTMAYGSKVWKWNEAAEDSGDE